MELNFLQEYIVIIILGICLCMGYVIKKSFTQIDNKYIPLIMAVTGVILNVWSNGMEFTPTILLGGLISGLASTGLHQAFTRIIEKEE
ncbi:MAG: phage holin family protein [Coprobacillaceae bacterium]